MKPLTARQAATCERATSQRCRCRCGGALHGAARSAPGATPEEVADFLREQPQDDPHFVRPADKPRVNKETSSREEAARILSWVAA